MFAKLIQIDPIRVAMVRHSGSYDGIGPVFDQLWDWVNTNGVPAQRTIGVYWDNPDFVATSRLRSAACVEVPPYYQVNNRGGLNLSLEDLPGGEYVTTRFVGPYEDLAPAWSQLTSYCEQSLGRQISLNPAFEVYVNDASTTPPEQLITELYMPLK